jgi:phage host-nuclease inhibitor protein Gam
LSETAATLDRSNISEIPEAEALANIDPVIDDISHLARIRDILFGEQSRDYNQKLIALEEKASRESHDLKKDFQVKIDTLTAYIQSKFETSDAQIKMERTERTDALKHLSEQYLHSHQLLAEQINNLDQKISTITNTLREEISINSKTVSDELRQKSNELLGSIEREVQILNDSSRAERRKLASYFVELSQHLDEA